MPTPEDAVSRFLTHLNEHDLPGALACLADGFELRFTGSEHGMTKEMAADALAWDAGTRGRYEWRVVEREGRRVTIEGRESNRFLTLLGIEALPFRSTYEVDEDGRIVRQTHGVEWGDTSLDDAMRPLLGWAARHEPSELDEIHPGGRMVYTEAMARRWVVLARRWRAAEP